MTDGLIVDLFAGPGGWDAGLYHYLDFRSDVVGHEWDAAACATRAAAGLLTIPGDLSRVGLDDRRPDLLTLYRRGQVDGLIASPPCQLFSNAGKGHGRELMAILHTAIRDAGAGVPALARHSRDMARVLKDALRADNPTWPRAKVSAEAWRSIRNARLVVEPARWAEALRPRWVALEQVPAVLPLWRTTAAALRDLGYSTWVGTVNAADHGVPQTRKRAVLIARLDAPAEAPVPTHAKDPQPTLFGEPEPWVSMAEALGWGWRERPSTTVTAGPGGKEDGARWGGSAVRQRMLDAQGTDEWADKGEVPVLENRRDSPSWVEEHGERRNRPADEPAPTITGEAHRWRWGMPAGEGIELVNGNQDNAAVRGLDEPAPTVAFGHNANRVRWRVRTGQHTYKHSRRPEDAVPYERDVDQPSPTVRSSGNLTVHPDLEGAVVNTGRDWPKGGTRADAQTRPIDQPAPAFDGHARSWNVDRPWRANRNDQSDDPAIDRDWPLERPATTIAGRDLVPDPGTNANRFNGAAKSRNDGIRITVEQAAALQSFPPGYPWRGTRTKQYEQVGNAVPPLLAARLVAPLLPPGLIGPDAAIA